MIKARVAVTLKNGVLDPQGKAIVGALGSLGFDGVNSARQGKVFDLELNGSDKSKAEADLKAMRKAARQHGDRGTCHRLTRQRTETLMKSAVILLPGLNRDRDMIAALTKITGQAPVTVWQTDTAFPADVDLILIPGSFSYGDYLRCGAIAARMPVMQAVREKADKGVMVMGNATVSRSSSARLLPGALMRNASLKFVCREVKLESNQRQHVVHARLQAGPNHPLPGRAS